MAKFLSMIIPAGSGIPHKTAVDQRRLLSNKRTLGSVIKLLTPSITEYSDDYNQWLKQIPQHIWALVLMIKRFYKDGVGAKLAGTFFRRSGKRLSGQRIEISWP